MKHINYTQPYQRTQNRWYTYHLINRLNGDIIYTGITQDPALRAKRHRYHWNDYLYGTRLRNKTLATHNYLLQNDFYWDDLKLVCLSFSNDKKVALQLEKLHQAKALTYFALLRVTKLTNENRLFKQLVKIHRQIAQLVTQPGNEEIYTALGKTGVVWFAKKWPTKKGGQKWQIKN